MRISMPETAKAEGTGVLRVESFPRTSGRFHELQKKVQQSLVGHLVAKGYSVVDDPFDSSLPLLIIFHSQGRVGDEIQTGVPREVYQGSRRLVLVIIQDDEYSRTDKSCLPSGFDPILIMNIHVIPGQQVLHSAMSGLCERNALELKQLTAVLPPISANLFCMPAFLLPALIVVVLVAQCFAPNLLLDLAWRLLLCFHLYSQRVRQPVFITVSVILLLSIVPVWMGKDNLEAGFCKPCPITEQPHRVTH